MSFILEFPIASVGVRHFCLLFRFAILVYNSVKFVHVFVSFKFQFLFCSVFVLFPSCTRLCTKLVSRANQSCSSNRNTPCHALETYLFDAFCVFLLNFEYLHAARPMHLRTTSRFCSFANATTNRTAISQQEVGCWHHAGQTAFIQRKPASRKRAAVSGNEHKTLLRSNC